MGELGYGLWDSAVWESWDMGCGIVRYGRVEIWAVGLYGMGELRYGLWDSAVWES